MLPIESCSCPHFPQCFAKNCYHEEQVLNLFLHPCGRKQILENRNKGTNIQQSPTFCLHCTKNLLLHSSSEVSCFCIRTNVKHQTSKVQENFHLLGNDEDDSVWNLCTFSPISWRRDDRINKQHANSDTRGFFDKTTIGWRKSGKDVIQVSQSAFHTLAKRKPGTIITVSSVSHNEGFPFLARVLCGKNLSFEINQHFLALKLTNLKRLCFSSNSSKCVIFTFFGVSPSENSKPINLV